MAALGSSLLHKGYLLVAVIGAAPLSWSVGFSRGDFPFVAKQRLYLACRLISCEHKFIARGSDRILYTLQWQADA